MVHGLACLIADKSMPYDEDLILNLILGTQSV